MLVVLNPANDTAQVHPHRGRRCHLQLMHRRQHRLPMCEREQGTSRDAEGRREKGGGAPTTTRRPNQLECYEVAADSPKLSYEAWCMPPARISPNDPKIYFLGPSNTQVSARKRKMLKRSRNTPRRGRERPNAAGSRRRATWGGSTEYQSPPHVIIET